MSNSVFDVAILSDFRYPGGTSASVAEEIKAQAAAGLSTALIHVPSPYLKSFPGFNHRIVDCLREGSAELVLRGDTVNASVLVLRQPRIFTTDPEWLPRINTGEVIMAVNQGPRDLDGGKDYYELAEVSQRVERHFGPQVRWTPIGPLVRQQVLSADPLFELEPRDWYNIIDAGHWWVDRSAPLGEKPIIGRHSRPAPVKWPQLPDEILQAYPATADFSVRVLGGGELATQRLGFQPENWEVIPFGKVHPLQFLRSIDYFVYFHDPSYVEAFGRSILEAMASGTPVIVPESFRDLFEDAAIYGTPAEVQGIVRNLHADWATYLEVSNRARSFVDERFGYRAHVNRLSELGVTIPADSVPPRPQISAVTRGAPDSAPAISDDPSGRLMMLSSNGAGLGHLTRLMSIARRLPQSVQSVIATQSYGASVVHQTGFLTEYIPSASYLDIPPRRWNDFLHSRLTDLLATHQPKVVAVDGTVPYNGLLKTMEEHPAVTWVWVRRAMWKRDQGEQWLERGRAFDFVLEPGEFAAAADEGPTVAQRGSVKLVNPIVYLDPHELLDAQTARRELDLHDGPSVLLQLGAGNINDISSPVARIADFLTGHGFQIVLAQSPIATRALQAPPGAQIASVYPLSRYLRAFDLVVSATGYNSFHELIAYGSPTVFVPNNETALDDQVARARYAEEAGVGLAIYDPASAKEVEEVLSAAIKPDVRAGLARRCAELAPANGAEEAAAWMSAFYTLHGAGGGPR